MEKAVLAKSRTLNKDLHLEIFCRANLLPLKSLIYALSFSARNIKASKKTAAGVGMRKVMAQVRQLRLIAQRLRNSEELDPDELAELLRLAVGAYVNLFYALNSEGRKSYLSVFGKMTMHKRMADEENLLLIPALMAEKKRRRNSVAKGLFISMYKRPFSALYESSRSAMHIAMLERSMAIKSVPDGMLAEFSKIMSKIDARISMIEQGKMSPIDDERFKMEFIAKAMEITAATDINIADFICEKVGTSKVNKERVQKLARR